LKRDNSSHNVFWGVRSEIKPSGISPIIYREWLERFQPKPGVPV
jgi:hypothetical protein